MQEKKTFAFAEVKSLASENPNGEFEVIMSTESVDRDGERIVRGAFDPLPESIPVHAFHDFNDPVGRAVPSYDSEGRLVGRGFFASTARAQEVRQLVQDGVIGHTSVGFMAAERKDADGVPEIKSGELLEVSFVSVPSNRDAAVLMAKAYDVKSPTESLCAKCAQPTTPAPVAPADEAGKSPASAVVEACRIRANALLLSTPE